VSCPALLDLSATFDTVSTTTLLSRLETDVGISGVALLRCCLYLFDSLESFLCACRSSCRDPWRSSKFYFRIVILYLRASSKMVLQSPNISCHFYADHTQLHQIFNLREAPTAKGRPVVVVLTAGRGFMETF